MLAVVVVVVVREVGREGKEKYFRRFKKELMQRIGAVDKCRLGH